VVPVVERPDPEVLQHDDRRAGGDFAQHVLEARSERVRDQAVAARGGEHLDLQASLARGNVDLRHQVVRRDLDVRMREHRRERGRTALVLGLRKERHFLELCARRKIRGPRITQRCRLREKQRRAAVEQQRANKNARGEAGVFWQQKCLSDHLLNQKYQINTAIKMTTATAQPSPPAGSACSCPLSERTSSSVSAATRSFAVAASRPSDCSWLDTSERLITLNTAARSACDDAPTAWSVEITPAYAI